MALKNIAVFLDLTPAGRARAQYAVRLAFRHGAHLIGIFVPPSGWHVEPAESFVRGHKAIQALIDRHWTKEIAAIATADRRFEAASSREDITFEFRVVRERDADEQAKLHALHADLVIVGHPGSGGLPRYWSAETMLLTTGVPFLVLPDEWKGEVVPERILLGWNASREARRAITDSLPILKVAQSVALIVVDAADNPRHGEEPGADVALYLARHGVNVTVEQMHSNGLPVADVILNFARDNKINFIVIGAYSHSRSREIIFGGVTRSLLNKAEMPLLIAH
ncbi:MULTISPECIES: universal stress protein [unclassified Afipia]|jgi:nucleotide-binding universal stress UspA family protein|uniref:universal stress protein n=1 Tax=unclassified Afipia TaxID=2642050 RepID=UPI000466F9D1|nr:MULTISPECIES: universal stress protein [unclassified Afipia]